MGGFDPNLCIAVAPATRIGSIAAGTVRQGLNLAVEDWIRQSPPYRLKITAALWPPRPMLFESA